MNKPDILMFVSDQHTASVAGFMGDEVIRTPNLDNIARKGTVFDRAYTPCPLCVPARMAMLTGMLPSELGILNNNLALSEEQITIAHSLAAVGYETVLCGRMHFVGQNQNHGFTKRLGQDITPQFWGRGGPLRTELGTYAGTLAEEGAFKHIGGGNSPVLEYDRSVIREALSYLSVPHEKPQFIVVGLYAPHFPYVCPSELYGYYKDKVIPPTLTADYDINPYLHRVQNRSQEDFAAAKAAYYGMVENVDEQLGETFNAYQEFLAIHNRKGLFLYCSDHGDMLGELGIVGKETFFDNSVRVPLIIEGCDVPKNKRIADPVSLIDLYPTLCEIANAPQHPFVDGVNIFKSQKAISELLLGDFMGRMIAEDDYQYSCFPKINKEYLFKGNKLIVDDFSDKRNELYHKLFDNFDEDGIIKRFAERTALLEIHGMCGKLNAYEEPMKFIPPKDCLYPPTK